MAIPVLYVLMRTDLASMNPGKKMAQANHAASSFYHFMHLRMCETDSAIECETLYNNWAGETKQGFGTTIVLAVDKTLMFSTVKMARDLGFYAVIVNDPTYVYKVPNEIVELINPNLHTSEPVVGEFETILFRNEDTCAWIFTSDKNSSSATMLLGNLPLHP